ncbi:MFS transporter [Marinobacterium nitratireducens]|uniref:MFS transporter n=1 Tax=Marinobacterium nitratireducens TaxID=518897 RepID=A0A917Z967_9GAMM|nr:cyanate transporter [Marinobacterium nitratireducens]GGO78443.1 MFS transporter [Marinobacterium nitratireducens]
MSGTCANRPEIAATSDEFTRLAGWLLLVLVGFNLRPFLTALSPVLPQVQAETGLENGTAAVLTTLPFLLMGVMALAGPGLARRYGEQRMLLGALVLLALGAGGRLLIGPAAAFGLVLTALLAGTGIALVQALLPGVAKRWFGARVPLAMGLYSAALVGGGALGAMVAPLASDMTGDWRPGLAVWALPALLAWLLWLWLAPEVAHDTAVPSVRRFVPLPRAWLLAVFFGLGNSGYSSLVAWLPAFYQANGMPVQDSGGLLAWMSLFQSAAALLMPLLRRGTPDLRLCFYASLSLQCIGFCAFALAPMSAPLLWIAIAGLGLGGFFSLCLTLCLEHLLDARAAGSLAAFMQGLGFGLTALGPWAVGALLDQGGRFEFAWGCHACLTLVLLLLSRRFDPAGYARALEPGRKTTFA